MDLGHAINESVIKKGLRELNPGLHFDMGGKLDIPHPQMNRWQGVFVNGHHLTSMDRGMIPEYKVWGLKKEYDPKTNSVVMGRSRILTIGWRVLFESLIRHKIPGISYESLSKKFKVPMKKYHGATEDLMYDPVLGDTRRVGA